MPRRDIIGLGLAGLLGFAGVAHFVNPGFFDEIVPHALPGTPRELDLRERRAPSSPARRRWPGRRPAGSAGSRPRCVFVAVFPANVQMAVDWRSRPVPEQAAAYGRLPLQIPLVLWALKSGATPDRSGARDPMEWRKITVAEVVPGDHVRLGGKSSTSPGSSRRSSARPRSCA